MPRISVRRHVCKLYMVVSICSCVIIGCSGAVIVNGGHDHDKNDGVLHQTQDMVATGQHKRVGDADRGSQLSSLAQVVLASMVCLTAVLLLCAKKKNEDGDGHKDSEILPKSLVLNKATSELTLEPVDINAVAADGNADVNANATTDNTNITNDAYQTDGTSSLTVENNKSSTLRLKKGQTESSTVRDTSKIEALRLKNEQAKKDKKATMQRKKKTQQTLEDTDELNVSNGIASRGYKLTQRLDKTKAKGTKRLSKNSGDERFSQSESTLGYKGTVRLTADEKNEEEAIIPMMHNPLSPQFNPSQQQLGQKWSYRRGDSVHSQVNENSMSNESIEGFLAYQGSVRDNKTNKDDEGDGYVELPTNNIESTNKSDGDTPTQQSPASFHISEDASSDEIVEKTGMNLVASIALDVDSVLPVDNDNYVSSLGDDDNDDSNNNSNNNNNNNGNDDNNNNNGNDDNSNDNNNNSNNNNNDNNNNNNNNNTNNNNDDNNNDNNADPHQRGEEPTVVAPVLEDSAAWDPLEPNVRPPPPPIDSEEFDPESLPPIFGVEYGPTSTVTIDKRLGAMPGKLGLKFKVEPGIGVEILEIAESSAAGLSGLLEIGMMINSINGQSTRDCRSPDDVLSIFATHDTVYLDVRVPATTVFDGQVSQDNVDSNYVKAPSCDDTELYPPVDSSSAAFSPHNIDPYTQADDNTRKFNFEVGKEDQHDQKRDHDHDQSQQSMNASAVSSSYVLPEDALKKLSQESDGKSGKSDGVKNDGVKNDGVKTDAIKTDGVRTDGVHHNNKDDGFGDDDQQNADQNKYLEELLYKHRPGSQKLVRTPSSRQDELMSSVKTAAPFKLDHSMITKGKVAGQGSFGTVYRAVLKHDGRSVNVAVKELKVGLGERDKLHFLQEADLLAQLKHPNVIAVIGSILDIEPHCIVMELCEDSLLSRLRHPPRPFKPANKVQFCLDIASGCSYLYDLKFIHRDLACRNVLVDWRNRCKIADFGLACPLAQDKDYYKSSGGKIPLRWCAPECINFRRYSSWSEIWAYGVILFEVFSDGAVPYLGLSNIMIAREVSTGLRLAPSETCPMRVYSLQSKCWKHVPTERVPFPIVCAELQAILNEGDYTCVPETLSKGPKFPPRIPLNAKSETDGTATDPYEVPVISGDNQDDQQQQKQQQQQQQQQQVSRQSSYFGESSLPPNNTNNDNNNNHSNVIVEGELDFKRRAPAPPIEERPAPAPPVRRRRPTESM